MIRRLEEITHIQTYSGKGVLFTQKEKKKREYFFHLISLYMTNKKTFLQAATFN